MTPDHSAKYEEIRELLRTNEPESKKKAEGMLRELAEADLVDAQTDMGFVLLSGSSDPTVHAEAIYWFERAAKMGSVQAAFNLGVLYQTGQGVPVELEKARKYFGQAAQALHPEGAFNYALLTRKLEAPKEDLQEAMARLEEVSAQCDNAAAHYAVGLGAAEGWVDEADMSKAVIHFEKAVEGGHVSAAYNLGVIFYYGNAVVPADRAKARHYLETAAKQGHQRAKEALNDSSFNESTTA